MQMQKEFKEEGWYDFAPETYILPYEMNEFRNCLKSPQELEDEKRKKKNKAALPQQPDPNWNPPVFILKPECQSQGRGIFLTRTAENLDPLEHLVA